MIIDVSNIPSSVKLASSIYVEIGFMIIDVSNIPSSVKLASSIYVKIGIMIMDVSNIPSSVKLAKKGLFQGERGGVLISLYTLFQAILPNVIHLSQMIDLTSKACHCAWLRSPSLFSIHIILSLLKR